MIHGTLNQNNIKFGASSGKQCVANAFASLIFSTLVPISEWTSELLDAILGEGDALYKKIQCKFPLLLIEDIPQVVTMFGHCFRQSCE